MKNTETKSPTTRRCVFFAPDIAERLDKLQANGVMVSSVISAALRQTLTTIEKKVDSGRTIPGLRVRKGR